MMRLLLFVVFYSSSILYGQNRVRLDVDLTEISGIQRLNKDLFVAHNDSGDGPYLYFLNGSGELLQRTFVLGASNIDWEDIAYDKNNTLYVGDFGNNRNNRSDLCLYRIPIDVEELKDSIVAERFNYTYPDQNSLSPIDSELNFDVESMVYIEGSLYIFSKNRTTPFDGVSKIYKVDLRQEDLSLKCIQNIKIPGKSWLRSSITGADYSDGRLFLLTYKKVLEYVWNEDEVVFVKKWSFFRLKQRESICYDRQGFIWIGSEKSMLSKQHLKRIKWKLN